MDKTETLATRTHARTHARTHTHTHTHTLFDLNFNTLYYYGTVNFKYKTIQIRTKGRILLQRILA